MSSAADKGHRITEFLDSGVWLIAPDRVTTRRAIFENLLRLPDLILASVFADLRILVFAPPLDRIASVVPYVVQSGMPPIRFSVVYLDARIESGDFATGLAAVAAVLGNAFANIAGVEWPASGSQDEPQTAGALGAGCTDYDFEPHGRPN